ncbi:MAG: Peptidase S8 and S53, subtilisin, kexin, sedolisin [Candidatus Daviesbacteria bacterium GW2011_GWB1_41_5]|uniref:Peptidase S8 and S53, subtilisin, kexin, sedolisin n=2 Tax=Patescibacteria group TaxID=1783273 RepID=A0A0G0WGK3_9BACT|nr:MAG: Peptidase S8 and S53, subtilisin, kexin, sedolisin [Candidatus Daviesbacteria bacterium GW2011_GWB1_41_5]
MSQFIEKFAGRIIFGLLFVAVVLVAIFYSTQIFHFPDIKQIVRRPSDNTLEKGTILARFKPGTSGEAIDKILLESNLTKVTEVDGNLILSVLPNKTEEKIETLRKNPEVSYADQDHIFQEKTAISEDLKLIPTACIGTTFDKNLSAGADDPDVKCLQAVLNRDPEVDIPESGVFDDSTKQSLAKFQEKNNIASTGTAGDATIKVLNDLVPQEATSAAAEDRTVLLSFKPGISQETMDKILQEEGLTKKETIGKTVEIQTDEGETLLKINSLMAREEIEYAEPNYIVHALAPPNDPYYPKLWGMKKIDAEKAWDVTTGSNNIVVGVVDSGVDYNHEDLAANIWSNPGGIWGCPAGTHGYNAIYGKFYTCNPMDDDGHGTKMAGSIGGIGNNGIGVAGVNWNVRIMALKFLNSLGSGEVIEGIKTIDFAINI